MRSIRSLWILCVIICVAIVCLTTIGRAADDPEALPKGHAHYRVITATVLDATPDAKSLVYTLKLKIYGVDSPPAAKEPTIDDAFLSSSDVVGEKFLDLKRGDEVIVISKNHKTMNDHVILILTAKPNALRKDTHRLRVFANH